MRLFYALCFDRPVLDLLEQPVRLLRDQSQSGSFTRRENLHLTLVFLGNALPLSKAVQVLNAMNAAPFDLVLEGAGRFPRTDGDIYWIGVRESPQLAALHTQLICLLKQAGFRPEQRPFRPHLTLGRRVVLHPDSDHYALTSQLPSIPVHIRSVSLMNSERPGDVLTYSRQHIRTLEQPITGGE